MLQWLWWWEDGKDDNDNDNDDDENDLMSQSRQLVLSTNHNCWNLLPCILRKVQFSSLFVMTPRDDDDNEDSLDCWWHCNRNGNWTDLSFEKRLISWDLICSCQIKKRQIQKLKSPIQLQQLSKYIDISRQMCKGLKILNSNSSCVEEQNHS